MTLKGIRVGAVLLAMFLAMIFNGLGLWSYWSYVSMEKVLKAEKNALFELKQEVVLTKSQLEAFEDEKKRFEAVLFNERDIPAFLDEISNNAKEENVQILSMRTKKFHQVKLPEDVEKKRKHMMAKSSKQKTDNEEKIKELKRVVTLSALPIAIKIKGPFPDLTQFLNRLEAHKQLTNISEVEIERGREYPDIECEFILRIFSLQSLSQFKL